MLSLPELRALKSECPEEFALLVDPRTSLPSYATVLGQDDSTSMRYDPYEITDRLQYRILDYVGAKRRTVSGELTMLALLAYRQGGKSTLADLALYPDVMYNEGHYHLTSADTSDRADYLHGRLQFNHDRWPEEIRVAQKNTRESLKLEFVHGGRMDVISGGSHAAGVGRSPDSYHASEIPLHKAAETEWGFLFPAMANRKEARVIMESTPYKMSEPSAEFFKDICISAKRESAKRAAGEGGTSRWEYIFEPFWDGKLNRRPVPDGYREDNEELRLLERYGHLGLSRENLSFRRFTMEMVSEIRRHPELFGVFYPFNDIDCWLVSSGAIIPAHAVAKQTPNIRKPLRITDDGVSIFKEPSPNAVYAMGIDPAGFGADHHAFQVGEIWDGEWEQVAVFGKNMNPYEFYAVAYKYLLFFNNARACPERNGVGMGFLTYLEDRQYRNIHHDAHYKPGVARHAHDKHVEVLIDAMLDELILHDEITLADCQSYKGDKILQRSPAATILHPSDPRRRDRDHWDKVSALFQLCVVARHMPRRRRPAPPVEPKPSSEWDWDQWEKYRLATQPKKNTSLVKMRRR